ncbi:DNA topoisomerase I [Candidatus Thorarchaeota archaeon]|nr:MAG: DNA topoisomerase I [Candidatus Thorarchaeota archaeon]
MMLITEKPSAAKKIANALDDEKKPREIKKGKISYFECTKGNNDLVVVYALGHLYELKQSEKGWIYPRFENKWVPKYEVDKKATNIKPLINLITKLAKEVDDFVVATDYDIEGSLIGYLTLKYACKANPEKAKRMRFSSLTDLDLQCAFERMTNLDFPMIESGQVRHEVDWLYGINLTRALTLSIKKTAGWFKVVSTGRVQGPTLSFVAEKEKEINLFVPLPFWSISIIGEREGEKIELEYFKRQIQSKEEANNIVRELYDQISVVKSINKRTVEQNPNPPFNLSSLQSEAYRYFGFKPSRTLDIAQSLYLDALISYPRTSSEQLPETLDVKAILTGLVSMREYALMAKEVLKGRLEPVQGKKTDPAHPAIHPTGEKPTKRLTTNEKNLYDLIVKRFLSLFGEPLVKDHLRADIKCNKHILYLRGLQILKRGWTEYYEPYFKANERALPNIEEGESIRIDTVDFEEKYTQPPARFNPSSLLKLLERENLGTKTTRSRIVDSVKSRGYTVGERFELSTLGYALYDTLGQYVPIMLSTEMTRQLEKEMDAIQNRESNREYVLEHTKSNLLEILEKFKEQEDKIGEGLVKGLQRYWKDTEELGPCPRCVDGILRIVQSPKTGKRFIGCSNYKDGKCDQTFPLPQKGTISPLDKMCPFCDHRMIRVVSGRRAWETCINWTQCPGRQEELKSLEQRRERQTSRDKGEKDND